MLAISRRAAVRPQPNDTDEGKHVTSDELRNMHFPPDSLLNELPELVKWRVIRAAARGQPSLREIYGEKPAHYVVAALRHGAGPLASTLSQNITNKAVISALLLTFNYPALFAAADIAKEGGEEHNDDALFRAYFFFQMTSVLCAFCVMISAAIFVSHVLRCGQHVDSIIRYLTRALWIDNSFNEGMFIAQCAFTLIAIMLYVALSYPGTLAWLLAGLVGAMTVVLIAMLLWSTSLFHVAAELEWDELCGAEAEFRNSSGGGGGGGRSGGLRAGPAIGGGGDVIEEAR